MDASSVVGSSKREKRIRNSFVVSHARFLFFKENYEAVL